MVEESVVGPPVLRKSRLHSSLSDPVLDTMNFLNEVTLRYPEAISFAPGRPYDGFFETEEVVANLRRYLDHLAGQGVPPDRVRTAIYQYGPAAGQIREIIADSLRRDEGIDVPVESIVVTVGAQEAMMLVVRALIRDPEDVLLVSSPCYVGITGVARLLDVTLSPVAESAEGFCPDTLAAAVRAQRAAGRRPRAFYLVPDHANPSGSTLSAAARVDLLELAAREDLLILEDTPYRLVSPGEPLPTLKAMDRRRSVVHLGSYSKTIFPGARVGFAVADQTVVGDDGRAGLLAGELSKIKSMVTVNTSSLSQAVVAGALLAAGGRTSELNAKAAGHYGDAMRRVLDRLAEHLPAPRRAELGVRWNEPGGGFFLNLTVGFEADDEALTRCAEEYGVIWTPMRYFHPEDGGRNSMRLSISYLSPDEIDEGIACLVAFIVAETRRHRTRQATA
uniref:Aminotransferase n=1 Tax=uncultured bacterium esnapd16.1 TaxID=1366596 RepID=S5TV08_9BACT|nr:aminotransferase [uncultured bacterium esnapd16.1]